MIKLLRLVRNQRGRDFIIGDLHGEVSLLRKALGEVMFDSSKDRLFSVGDLVDRGEDSIECLNLLTKDWFFSVRGNHEDMMITSVLNSYLPQFHTQETWMWYQNGGRWAEEFYAGTEFDSYLVRLVEEANKLPISIEILGDDGTPLVGICHAQPLPDWEMHGDLTKDEQEYILWGREWASGPPKECRNISQVYCGHTPQVGGPKDVGNVRFIDTGACFEEGSLTMEEIKYD